MAWEPVSAGEAETEDQGMEGDMAQSTEQDTGGDVRPLWQDARHSDRETGSPGATFREMMQTGLSEA